MATTSPDNIWTPDSGDDYALTVDLAATADTVQDALNKIPARSGLSVDMPAAGNEGNTYYATDTNRSWFDNGSTWLSNDPGMHLIRPSGVTSSSGGTITLASNGQINFSSIPAGSYFGFTGGFSSRFSSYLIHYSMTGSVTAVSYRLSAGGSNISSADYSSTYYYINNVPSVTPGIGNDQTSGVLSPVAGSHLAGQISVFDPASSSLNTRIIAQSSAGLNNASSSSILTLNTVVDGLKFNTAGTASGWIKLYGLA